MTVLWILSCIMILYVLSTMCRRGHKDWKGLEGWLYTHRGLCGPGVPENGLTAFRKSMEAGYGIELDVHLMQDGSLAVIHDSSLLRTTGIDSTVEQLRAEDLSACFLENTRECIPTFQEVLELIDGRVPLIVELKPTNYNWAELCEVTCQQLKDYQGTYCLESFDPRCIFWLRRHRPDIVRGQLTMNYFAGKQSKLPCVLKFLLVNQMLNFLVYPDFIAYHYTGRKHMSNWIVRRIWGAGLVTWTVNTQEALDCAIQDGWVPIFEGFIPEKAHH